MTVQAHPVRRLFRRAMFELHGSSTYPVHVQAEGDPWTVATVNGVWFLDYRRITLAIVVPEYHIVEVFDPYPSKGQLDGVNALLKSLNIDFQVMGPGRFQY